MSPLSTIFTSKSEIDFFEAEKNTHRTFEELNNEPKTKTEWTFKPEKNTKEEYVTTTNLSPKFKEVELFKYESVSKINDTSTNYYDMTVVKRRLDVVIGILYQMIDTEEFLDLPVFYSQIKDILRELFSKISKDKISLKVQISYLEQAILSSGWEKMTKGQLKTLIQIAENIKKKGKWDVKGIKSTAGQITSSNFRLNKPVVYEEG